MKVLKLYGERNTGTNYLSELCARNYAVNLLRGTVPRSWARSVRQREWGLDLYFRLTTRGNLGWKHRMAPDKEELKRSSVPAKQLLFITLTKNPYAWLVSLHRRPYHNRSSFSSWLGFLATPWQTVGREHHPEPFLNPIVMWNEKNASYLRLAEVGSCVNLRYEDLLADPGGVCGQFAQEYGLTSQGGDFINIEQGAKGVDKERDFHYYQDYYQNQRWRRKLTPESIELINQHLNPHLLAAFSYEMLSPADIVDF